MTHTPVILSEFQSGESRMIFGRHRDGRPGLFRLPEGAAQELRSFTKVELMCPVPGCQSPDFTTVSRRLRGRDGFRHLRKLNIGHSAESQFHVDAKAEIGAWARVVIPGAIVTEEDPSNAARTRVADVMVTMPDGQRIALEVQYSSLTPSAWEARHLSYREQGIADFWIFGHVGPQLRLEGRGTNRVALTPTQQLLISAGSTLIWMNPTTRQLAVVDPATVRSDSWSEYPRFSAGLQVRPLDEFTLSLSEGPVHPELVEGHEATRRIVRVGEREAAARREASRKAAVKAAAKEEERARVKARRELLTTAWLESADGRTALKRFNGIFPSWIGVEFGVVTEVPSRMWQWYLFGQSIDGAPENKVVRIETSCRLLTAEFGIPANVARELVSRWFTALAGIGALSRRRSGTIWRPVVQYHIPVNPLVQPTRPAPRSTATPARRGLGPDALTAAAVRRDNAAGAQAARETEARAELAVAGLAAAPLKCTRCQRPLDPVLATRGLHILCETSPR